MYPHYRDVVKGANVLIGVYLDKDTQYNHTKDILAIGAAIQNMLLACEGLGWGCLAGGDPQPERAGERHPPGSGITGTDGHACYWSSGVKKTHVSAQGPSGDHLQRDVRQTMGLTT